MVLLTMDDKQYQKLCRWTNRADCSVLACRPIMVEIAIRKGFEIYMQLYSSKDSKHKKET